MIEVFFATVAEIMPFVALVTAVYAAIRGVLVKKGRKTRGSWGNEILRGLFAAYLAALFALTLVPDTFWSDLWALPQSRMLNAASQMFHGDVKNGSALIRSFISGEPDIRSDYILNIWLFVPLGFILPILFRKLKWWQTDLICLGTSCVIEALQPIVGRSLDVDDLITNLFGAAAGCALAKLFQKLAENTRKNN